MAKIIKKGNQLEEKYYMIEQERTNKSAQAMRLFSKIMLVTTVIYIVSIMLSIVAGIFSITFMPLTVCLGFILITVLFVCLIENISENTDTDILISGINGERIAAEVLSALPDSYTVFQDVMIIYDGKASEIDNIVVGSSGVFIVETKNHNGNIIGDFENIYWTQHKVGRGGTHYSKEIYSPVKQVGTHIYRLANYLRQNGIYTYVEGMVYFTNPSCVVQTTGNNTITVYSSFNNDEDRLCKRILSKNSNLDLKSINHICELINNC